MEDEDRLGMTPEQWARFQAYTNGYSDPDKNAIDLSALRENLKLTPTERLEKMLRTLAFFKEVQRARESTELSTHSRRTP